MTGGPQAQSLRPVFRTRGRLSSGVQQARKRQGGVLKASRMPPIIGCVAVESLSATPATHDLLDGSRAGLGASWQKVRRLICHAERGRGTSSSAPRRGAFSRAREHLALRRARMAKRTPNRDSSAALLFRLCLAISRGAGISTKGAKR